jgi:hypothetical protein
MSRHIWRLWNSIFLVAPASMNSSQTLFRITSRLSNVWVFSSWARVRDTGHAIVWIALRLSTALYARLPLKAKASVQRSVGGQDMSNVVGSWPPAGGRCGKRESFLLGKHCPSSPTKTNWKHCLLCPLCSQLAGEPSSRCKTTKTNHPCRNSGSYAIVPVFPRHKRQNTRACDPRFKSISWTMKYKRSKNTNGTMFWRQDHSRGQTPCCCWWNVLDSAPNIVKCQGQTDLTKTSHSKLLPCVSKNIC